MSAFKYHPDKNPGKELEFIAKFQVIQAAHEILSDPHQQKKYDNAQARLHPGYGRYHSTPRVNTSQKTPVDEYNSASAPKPPACPQPFQNGLSAGACQHASYACAAPQQPWWKKYDERWA